MASQLDRERERKKLQKTLKKIEADYRQRFGTDPSPDEMQSYRNALIMANLTGSTVTVPVAPRSNAQQPAEGRKVIEIGRFTETGLDLNVPLTPEIARRAKLMFHCNRFEMAEAHAVQIDALQHIILSLTEMAGINAPWLEVPPVLALIADLDDFKRGRSSRLLSRLADPVLPPPASNREETTRTWTAAAVIVGLGMSVETFDGLDQRASLLKVISDLEDQLGEPLDAFLPEGKPVKFLDDISARDARRERLVNRFVKDRPSLVSGAVPPGAKTIFDQVCKEVQNLPASRLRDDYPVAIIAAAGHVRNARDRDDTKVRAKAGKMRLSTDAEG